MSLEKLEKKVEGAVKVNLKDYVKTATTDTDKIIEEIQRNYRLISNTNNRVEKKINNLEQKLNFIIKAIETSGVDLEELQKQEEIRRLENKLKELKGV